jgi:hypothetical protein
MIKRWLTEAWNDLINMVPPEWWTWFSVLLWAVPALVALWVLSLVKNVAGWPGVAAVAAVALYLAGFARATLGLPLWPF